MSTQHRHRQTTPRTEATGGHHDIFFSIKRKRMNPAANRAPMKQTIDLFKSDLSPAHISPDYFPRIAPILEAFPDAAVDTFILEQRLNKQDPFPDFSICFWNREHIGQTQAACPTPIGLPPGIFRDNRTGQNIRDFLAALHHHPGLEEIINTWLEFDITDDEPNFNRPSHDGDVPLPSVFFRVDTHRYKSWIADTALRMLNGAPIAPPIVNRLAHVFASLPTGALVSQVGLLLGRENKAGRLYISHLTPDSLLRFLETIGYPCQSAPIKKMLQPFDRLIQRLSVQIQFAEEIAPEIAIEFGTDNKKETWSPFLGKLVEHRYCSETDKNNLIGWADESFYRHTDEGSLFFLHRFISHIKLLYRPGKESTAKSYLGAVYS
ncbi:MAG: hypothetical protein GY765_11090 [bacterium]|nr:hypothetical protein [bacterium]